MYLHMSVISTNNYGLYMHSTCAPSCVRHLLYLLEDLVPVTKCCHADAIKVFVGHVHQDVHCDL